MADRWTKEREKAAMERRASPYCGTAWWVTGDPWGDELSIHAGPSNDPHLAVLTVCSFDTMSEQFRSEFDGVDCGDVDEIGREVMRCIVADHEDLMAAIVEIRRLREACEQFVMHYPHGINPYLDEAWRKCRELIAGGKS